MASSALDVAKDLASYNNKLEQSNVKLQYGYNQALAQEDRAWQERMANSAHQREIKDLKAAGLNPVLSVTGGNGAATGSGSSTQVSKPNVDMSLPGLVMDWATAQLNSATQLQRTAMETSAAWNRSVLETDAAWKRHISPSGNSFLGQLISSPDSIGRFLFGNGHYDWEGKGALGFLSSVLGFGKGKGANTGNNSATKYNGKTADEILSSPGHDIDDIIASFGGDEDTLSRIENWKGRRNYRSGKGGRRFLVPSTSKNFINGRGRKSKKKK